MILAVLETKERKFVANSRLKKAEKIYFLCKIVLIKTVLLLPFFLKDPVCGARRLVERGGPKKDFCSFFCCEEILKFQWAHC